jgi:hypothetical protein
MAVDNEPGSISRKIGAIIVVFITMGVYIGSDHRSDFDEPTCIQIKFPYVFMSCFPHMVQNITMKGERSLAVRTYPNVVQILRVHILLPCCNAAANFI